MPERPRWATARRRVHLETFELGAADLALDEREVAQLLPPDRRTAVIRRQARGWPAVIALAAHAGLLDSSLTASPLSQTIYDYLAQELFEGASTEVRLSLTVLSILPALEKSRLATYLAGEADYERMLETGLAFEDTGELACIR